jgi:uncharacterized cupin superfamily protein|tara:strand:+ start:682 stop:1173 length:492 start_codon:yes stop_codon:yes gene_type:complete
MSDVKIIPASLLIVDPKKVKPDSGSVYPKPFDEIVTGRHRHRLSSAIGLTKFGVNLVQLEPGARSSARHWHTQQDEFVFIVEGTATLVTNDEKVKLTKGMSVGFPAGNANGHQLFNESNSIVWYLEVGDRPRSEEVIYPDIDMVNTVTEGRPHFTKKNGNRFV